MKSKDLQKVVLSKYEHRRRFKRCGELPNSETMVSDDRGDWRHTFIETIRLS